MKTFIFSVFCFFLTSSALAQNTEYSIHLNSGLFSFGGETAVKHSFINVSDVATIESYTNNPYGKEKALSWGMAAQIQRITKGNLILGVQGGYEILSSKVDINHVFGEFNEMLTVTSGSTTLTHGFINVYPSIGKRINFDRIAMDITLGPEFGFNTFSHEKGEANTENNSVYKTDTNRSDPGTDIRIRPSLTLHYNNWGISAGYSYGLHNYSEDLLGGEREHLSRFIRFGIAYTIK